MWGWLPGKHCWVWTLQGISECPYHRQPKVLGLWDSALGSSLSCKQRVFMWNFSTEKTTVKLTRKTGMSFISSHSPPPPAPVFLSVTHSLDFFLWQPFKPEITGSVTLVISFILVCSRIQPPGETLLPVSICFNFVVYIEGCCGCNNV